MNKRTKIVATIGPASDAPDTIRALIHAGVNIFRFNTKHNEIEWHEERIKRVQDAADELKTSVGILLDLQGPEMRIETRDAEPVSILARERLKIYKKNTNDARVVLPYPQVFDVLHRGDHILVEDAYVDLEIVDRRDDYFVVVSHSDTVIKHRKGVNLPGKNIDLPSLTEKDKKYLEIAGKNKIDFVALSFVRTVHDVKILRNQMGKHNIEADIVAKIENALALENIKDIVRETDCVMVARGDLGVEVPIEELAFWQNTIIDLCRQENKPVITATQMLESMITNPYPTRAEATDIANAVMGGTDAIMLSGETAGGKYPTKAVHVMAKIAKFYESRTRPKAINKNVYHRNDLFAKIAMAVSDEENVPTSRFLVFTQTGSTARALSSLRPNVQIIAVTEHQKTVEKLTISYGVMGYKIKFPKGALRNPEYVIEQLKNKGVLEKGETLIMIHGTNWKTPGSTNTLSVIVS